MYASVRALLNQIIDYAGLFPPAKLPLEDALHNYLRYKKASPYAWMLGRFVCPTARLPELLALAKPHPDASLLSLTALGTQSSSANEFASQFEADLRAIERFRHAWGENQVIDMVEIPLSKDAPIDDVIPRFALVAERLQKDRLHGFLEIPKTPRWHAAVDQAAAEIRRLLDALDFDFPTFSLKLRCGGLTADAFPSDKDVAHFIDRCQAHAVSWKATAGLHHPRRHLDTMLQIWHHGFLNLFGTMLAGNNRLTSADIADILADRDAQHFRFEEDRLCWKQWSIQTTAITEARSLFATSFGSCSFEEPVEDLIAMGLLDPV